MNTDAHRWSFLVWRPRQLGYAAFTIVLCAIGLSLVDDCSTEAQEKKTGSSLSKLIEHQPPVVTGRVGWWKHQEGLEVEDFRVEITKKRVPITGKPTRTKIHITGKIRSDGSLPYISEVFVSERFANGKSTDKYVDVLVVPIVDHRSKPAKKDESVRFDVAVDYELWGYQWDDNRYVFRCGDKTVDVEFDMSKGK